MLSSVICKGQPVTPGSPDLKVPWWSFSKTVLAATALTLVRDGRVGLDVPVLGQAFTLRQLLRHEAGLADYGELAAYHAAVAKGEPAWPVEHMMQRLDGARLRYSPGTGWRYSNVGYCLVGTLIERLTGMALEDAVSQRVLAPLGLAGVAFAKTPADLQGASPENTYDPGWVYHGLLIGPVSQAALCLDRLLAGHLLTPGLLREMRTVKALGGPIAGRPWISPGYGLGLMEGAIEGGLIVSGHTGCGPGSVIAVYRACEGGASACCAGFEAGDSEGGIEAHVVRALREAL